MSELDILAVRHKAVGAHARIQHTEAGGRQNRMECGSLLKGLCLMQVVLHLDLHKVRHLASIVSNSIHLAAMSSVVCTLQRIQDSAFRKKDIQVSGSCIPAIALINTDCDKHMQGQPCPSCRSNWVNLI